MAYGGKMGGENRREENKKTKREERGGGGGSRICYKYEWKNDARGREAEKTKELDDDTKIDIIRIKHRYNKNRINR